MTEKIKVGMIGTGFVGDIHHMSFRDWVPDAELVAVSSPNNADRFAKERGIPAAYADYHEMLKDKAIDVVDIGASMSSLKNRCV